MVLDLQECAIWETRLSSFSSFIDSCYMASVMQVLFNVPPFRDRYLNSAEEHIRTCPTVPTDCYHCQMSKLAGGLFSGRYSQPPVQKPTEAKEEKDAQLNQLEEEVYFIESD